MGNGFEEERAKALLGLPTGCSIVYIQEMGEYVSLELRGETGARIYIWGSSAYR